MFDSVPSMGARQLLCTVAFDIHLLEDSVSPQLPSEDSSAWAEAQSQAH